MQVAEHQFYGDVSPKDKFRHYKNINLVQRLLTAHQEKGWSLSIIKICGCIDKWGHLVYYIY